MANPKIGTTLPNGSIQYPTETLSGHPYARADFDPPPAIVYAVGLDTFAIGDVFPPRGFDVNAALDALKAELTPTTKKGRGDAVEP